MNQRFITKPKTSRGTPGVRRRVRRQGLVLILVLIVIAILALSAYTYTALMQTEQEAVQLMGRRIQSRYLVDSGVESVRLFLSKEETEIDEAGGTFDNPDQFQGALVIASEDPKEAGYYTIISSALDEQGEPDSFRYGLTDESTRLNLNILLLADDLVEDGGRNLLLALPGMTDDIADAILDWIDPDDEPREFGAEAEYYSSLDPAYSPKNAMFETVEELLLVRGVTPQLLFGIDSNHNGVIDPEEESGGDALTGGLDSEIVPLGWTSYLTLYSKESNLTREGLPRIDVNMSDLEALHEELRKVYSHDWATFIVALRQNGPTTAAPEDTEPFPLGAEVDLTQSASYQLSQILDLVDAQVRIQFVDSEESITVSSPIRSEDMAVHLPLLMDNLTTTSATSIPGRININQASRAVLAGIPGIQPEVVDEIINNRSITNESSDPNHLFETWILSEGIVDLATMRTMLPFVCVGGNVYRAEIVGYYGDSSSTSRAEVVLDSTEAFPRILFWRDKSHLPLGYDLETLGTALSQ